MPGWAGDAGQRKTHGPNRKRKSNKQTINKYESLSDRYLGMPTSVGHPKKGTFKYLSDRIRDKIKSWMGKLLSAGGKDVLIKSVARAIPVYSMACFKIPRGLCEHINSLIRKFWWGSKQGDRKVAWVSWEVMTRPKYLGGLGFRDLELFNLALLARQSWRILKEPSSLSARILKSVYFPNGFILTAELGSRPSQIWRAILEGRDLMKQGIIRRIGNGKSTNIWSDNWIPKEASLRPILSRIANPPHMVSDLLLPATTSWNVDLVRRIFLPIDADEILKLPVCTRNVEDFWAWQPDRKGIFSVRSAYKFLSKTKMQRESWLEGTSDSSDNGREVKAWTSLWKISIPAKVKVFLWRLAKHSLPMTDVLQHRSMSHINTCVLCGAEDTWRHSLLSCTMSRCVWALSDEDLVEHMTENREPSAKNWIFEMHDTLTHGRFTRLVVTLWAIWFARRKAIHESIFQSPHSTNSFIDSYLNELQVMSKPPRQSPTTFRGRADSVPRWLPPPDNFMKINVDGAVSRNGGRSAATAIYRDQHGAYLGSSTVVFYGVTDPSLLEALACRESLALADDLGLARIFIASDCKGVVEDIQEGTGGSHGAVIREITSRMAGFESCKFIHERRNFNVKAHNLAKHSTMLSIGRHVWLGLPHDSILVPMNIVVSL